MKKYGLILGVMTAFALVGCQEIATEQPKQMESDRFSGPLTIHASWASEPDTKTAVQGDGVSVWWTTNEQINVFSGAAYSGMFTSTNTEPAESAYFKGGLSAVPGVSGSADDLFWAVYPYNESNSSDGQSVSMSIPSHQTASEGTFADKLFPAVARSSSLDDMRFYNVCGGACFTVSASNIRSVTFEGRNGESLAGTVRVAMDFSGRPVIQEVSNGETQVTVYAPSQDGYFVPGVKYYAVLIPQVLEKGMDVSFRTSSEVGTLGLSKSITITRSRFGLLEGKDKGLDFEGMPVDRLAFPDEVFGDYIFATFDLDGDGILSETELNRVDVINVSTETVSSVEGIGFFPNLMYLSCNGIQRWNSQTQQYEYGKLSSIDVSGNPNLRYLYCSYNRLSSLDISKNTQLVSLNCVGNQLTTLDFSNNAALTTINCGNNALSSLSISGNTSLRNLSCYGNQLTALDVSKNAALTSLSCYANQLAALDLSKNTALTSLNCGNNALTSLDISYNTSLQSLSCYSNNLTVLNVSNNVALTNINCGDNALSSLDVRNNSALSSLLCYSNQLTALDINRNTKLTQIDCGSNPISALDVSAAPQLQYLYSYNANLSEVNVSQNPELQYFDCSGNNLETLDVSQNANLVELYCNNNRLKELDVSNNPLLQWMNCYANLLVTLDVSENTALRYLACTDNPDLSELYLSEGQTIERLYKPDATAIVYVVNISADAFEDPSFRQYVLNSFDTNGNGTISEKERMAVTAMEITSGSISTLKGVEYFPNLISLKVLNVGLSALDVSSNQALQVLYCSGNSLSSLDVTSNVVLEELYCSNNSLTSLDLAQNPSLKKVDVRNNPIASLDLSHNGAVNTLWCRDNQFSSLDLTTNLLLKSLYCKDSPLLATVKVAKGHTFSTLEKDASTTVQEVSSGNGGGSEGFGEGGSGRWD